MDKKITKKFCPKPWEYIGLECDNIYSPCCTAWVNIKLGDIRKQGIEEVWNSPEMSKMRASVLDGSFSYCNKDLCPFILNGSLPDLDDMIRNNKFSRIISEKMTRINFPPEFINLSFDFTCNLKCPSCRPFMYGETEEIVAQKQIIMQKIIDFVLAQDKNNIITMNLYGSGDPFSSNLSRDFLFNFDGRNHPNIKFNLMTNGVLLDQVVWNRMENIHENINEITISLDAASKEVYDKIRVGGNWNKLMKNLEFLSGAKRTGKIKTVKLAFVVQKGNFREMKQFAKICEEFGFDAYYSRIIKWYDNEHIEDDMICEETHRLFPELVNILKDRIFASSWIDLGNLSDIRDIALDQLEKEDPASFRMYIDMINMNKKLGMGKQIIRINFKDYTVNKSDIVFFIDTDMTRINPDLTVKYDNTIKEWVECTKEESELFYEYRNGLS